MTISVTDVASGPFFPNGVTKSFPFAFSIAAGTELRVVLLNAAGQEEVLAAASYSVMISRDTEGGMITLANALNPDGRALWIMLDPSFRQETLFEDEGAFNSAVLNPVADAAARRDLFLRARINRAVLLPFGETGVVLPAAASRTSRIFGFNALGGVTLYPVDSFRGLEGRPGRDGTPGPGVTLDDAGGAADLRLTGLYGGIVGVPTDNAAAFATVTSTNTYFVEDNEFRMSRKVTFGAGGRFFGSTLEPRSQISLSGVNGGSDGLIGSVMRWPANTTGMRIGNRRTYQGAYAADTTRPGAAGSRLEGLYLLGGGGTDPDADGIRVQTVGIFRDLTIDNFSGCGMNGDANSNFTVQGNRRYGNNNGTFIERVTFRACRGKAALYWDGVDGNCLTTIAVQVKDTQNCGILDRGGYATCHINFEIDSTGESGKGRVNHNGKNYHAVYSDPAVLAATEPGTNYRIWLYYEDQAQPSAYWPAWVQGGSYLLGIGFAMEQPGNHGVTLAGYTEAFPQTAVVNTAESCGISIGGDFASTPDSGHIYRIQQGGAFWNVIYSKIGFAGQRDWGQQPNLKAYFGKYSIAGVAVAIGGNGAVGSGGFCDIYIKHEAYGEITGGLDGSNSKLWRFGADTPFSQSAPHYRLSFVFSTVAFGRSAAVAGVMEVPMLAIGHESGNATDARIMRYASAPPPGNNYGSREVRWNDGSNPAYAAVDYWLFKAGAWVARP